MEAQIIMAMFSHLVGDFILQTDYMATRKSYDDKALFYRCLVYGACFAWLGLSTMLIMIGSHIVIDATSSRIAARYFQEDNRRMFFVTIGIDQFVHYLVILTLLFM